MLGKPQRIYYVQAWQKKGYHRQILVIGTSIRIKQSQKRAKQCTAPVFRQRCERKLMPHLEVHQLAVLLIPVGVVHVEVEAKLDELEDALIGELVLVPSLSLLVLPPDGADPPTQGSALLGVRRDTAVAVLRMEPAELVEPGLPLLSPLGGNFQGPLLRIARRLRPDLLGVAVLQ